MDKIDYKFKEKMNICEALNFLIENPNMVISYQDHKDYNDEPCIYIDKDDNTIYEKYFGYENNDYNERKLIKKPLIMKITLDEKYFISGLKKENILWCCSIYVPWIKSLKDIIKLIDFGIWKEDENDAINYLKDIYYINFKNLIEESDLSEKEKDILDDYFT